MAKVVLHEILEANGLPKNSMVLGRNKDGNLLLPTDEYLASLNPEESGSEEGSETSENGDGEGDPEESGSDE